MRLFLFSILFLLHYGLAQANWQTLAPGLAYKVLPISTLTANGKLHALKIDLSHYQLVNAVAKDLGEKALRVNQFAELNNAVAAINGGFFTKDYEMLGLRVNKKIPVNPLRSVNWWSIFFIENGEPNILHTNEYLDNKNIEFAIQAGPRLIINNKIPKLKAGKNQRSAIGITQNNEVVLVVTELAVISTETLAIILNQPESEGGLGLKAALNLDGGSSTQFYINTEKLNVNLYGLSPVSDAILVMPKTKY